MTMAAKPSGHPKIGVLSPLLAGSYASNLIAAVTTSSRASGTRVVAIQTLDLDFGGPQERLTRSVPRGTTDDADYMGWPPGTEALVPRFTLRPAWEQVAGFLVVLNAVEPWYLQALRDAGKPVVMLSHEVEGFACPVVRADNRAGIAQAVSHLVGHGHRRIAFAGCLVQSDITERFAAYREALAAQGMRGGRGPRLRGHRQPRGRWGGGRQEDARGRHAVDGGGRRDRLQRARDHEGAPRGGDGPAPGPGHHRL